MIRPILSSDVEDQSHRQHDMASRSTTVTELHAFSETEVSSSSSYSINMKILPTLRRKLPRSLIRSTTKNLSNPDMIPLYQVGLNKVSNTA